MAKQEFKAWAWRQNHVPYLWHRFWTPDGSSFVEVHKVARKIKQKPGKERLSWEGREWSQSQETLSTSSRGIDGAAEINHLYLPGGGEGESMGNIPLAFKEHIEQMKKDHATARHFGLTIDLKEFHHMLGQDHVQGMFGRGRVKALMTLVYILIAVVALMGIGLMYVSSSPHIVCYTVGSNSTIIPCPTITHTAATSSSTVSTFTAAQVSTPRTENITVGGG